MQDGQKRLFVKAAIEESSGDDGMKHVYVPGMLCPPYSFGPDRLITYIYPLFLLSQSVQVSKGETV
jgi:hypothetical protein